MNDSHSLKETTERILLAGRIDSITAREVETLFRKAVMTGKRLLIADMTNVNYVSSAGLRIFISFQKELKKAGGEICLFNTTTAVYPVFEMSGLTGIFRFLTGEDELRELLEGASKPVRETRDISTDRMVLNAISKKNNPGSMSIIGSEEKLHRSGYCEADVETVPASEMRFATGLAALGNTFEDYKSYFGETAVVNGNIFVYPALKRSAVDFIIHNERNQGVAYHFLYGSSFEGRFQHIASFEPKDVFITLEELVDAAFLATPSETIGIAAIFESRGLFGMRLKKVPLEENCSGPETDIFSGDSFSEWVDYSIEPEDIHNLVVITGIAVKDRGKAAGDAQKAVPAEGRFHIHGIVFDKKPFNKIVDNFPAELKRVVTIMEPRKVLHLLGKTRVGPGLMGIVELGG